MTRNTHRRETEWKSAFRAGLRPADPGPAPHQEDQQRSAPSGRRKATRQQKPAKPKNDYEQFQDALGLTTQTSAAPAQGKKKGRNPAPAPKQHEEAVGFIAAKYESRMKPDAIGYDKKGGTSYGVYQIASGVGTFDRFLAHLDKRKPEWAERLRAAGEANTGSKEGGVPEEWKKIASEDPKGFAREQWRFIRQSHYDPALREIKKTTGMDLKDASRAVKEAVFSTAVQHGAAGAGKLFARAKDALEKTGMEMNDTNLIGCLYEARKGQFGGSSPAVQASVHRRFDDERGQVMLAMAQDTSSPGLSFKPS